MDWIQWTIEDTKCKDCPILKCRNAFLNVGDIKVADNRETVLKLLYKIVKKIWNFTGPTPAKGRGSGEVWLKVYVTIKLH